MSAIIIMRQLVAGSALAALMSAPLAAQAGGGMGGARSTPSAPQGQQATRNGPAQAQRTPNSPSNRAPATRAQFTPLPRFADRLTPQIAQILNDDEQEQAAEATLKATRGACRPSPDEPAEEDSCAVIPAEVGQSVFWASTSREGVSGSSTVTSREESGAEGADCIIVTDVVIVSGEEVRVTKRMCRAPGTARYGIRA